MSRCARPVSAAWRRAAPVLPPLSQPSRQDSRYSGCSAVWEVKTATPIRPFPSRPAWFPYALIVLNYLAVPLLRGHPVISNPSCCMQTVSGVQDKHRLTRRESKPLSLIPCRLFVPHPTPRSQDGPRKTGLAVFLFCSTSATAACCTLLPPTTFADCPGPAPFHALTPPVGG